ncbi:putative oligopeptide transporter, OPT superfamily [Helianthus anomalus]
MGRLGLATQHNCTTYQVRLPWSSRLGVGAFTLDWAKILAYHGSPLVTPWTCIVNVGLGFVMFIDIIVPICYRKYNTIVAQIFPIFSKTLFT